MISNEEISKLIDKTLKKFIDTQHRNQAMKNTSRREKVNENTDEKITPGLEQLEKAGSHNFTKEFSEGKFTKGETFSFSREQFKRWLIGDMNTSELENSRYKPKEENKGD